MYYTVRKYIKNLLISILIIFIFSVQISASDRTVTVIKHTMKGDEKLLLNSSAEKFNLGYGDYVTGISGLSSLHHLKTVEIEGTSFMHDFSFLIDCRQLTTLVIRECTLNNFDFLLKLPQLKNLVLQAVRCSSYPDIAEMNRLEYFEMSNSGLTDTRWLENLPQSVQILNLAYNEIQNIDISHYTSVSKIILTGNPLKNKKLPEKVRTGNDVYSELPEQYRMFVQ